MLKNQIFSQTSTGVCLTAGPFAHLRPPDLAGFQRLLASCPAHVVSSDLDLISLLLSTTEFEARPRRFYFGTEVTAHACVRPCRLLVVGHGMAPVNSDGLNWLLETPDI
jgi:hypothetical protein